MKRKSTSLIEEITDCGVLRLKAKSNYIETHNSGDKMSENPWIQYLRNAEKTAMVQDKKFKVHYKFTDGSVMVEEYNTDTNCLLRRAWNKRAKIGGEGRWEIEVGDPEPKAINNLDSEGIREANDQPTILKRCTRINLEWRIRNLPYPIGTYSVTVDENEKYSITIRTTNKKYFKKLDVPDLERLGLQLSQKNIEMSHNFNTLIITVYKVVCMSDSHKADYVHHNATQHCVYKQVVVYKKPPELLAMEKAWYQELKNVKTTKDDIGDCKPS